MFHYVLFPVCKLLLVSVEDVSQEGESGKVNSSGRRLETQDHSRQAFIKVITNVVIGFTNADKASLQTVNAVH